MENLCEPGILFGYMAEVSICNQETKVRLAACRRQLVGETYRLDNQLTKSAQQPPVVMEIQKNKTYRLWYQLSKARSAASEGRIADNG